MKKKNIKKFSRGIVISILALSVFLLNNKEVYAGEMRSFSTVEPSYQTQLETESPDPSETPVVTPAPKPVKNGLIKEGSAYRYYKNGKMYKNVWKKINDRKYYFKANGNAATYSYKIRGQYYIFSVKGQLLTPKKNKLIQIGKDKYYVSPKGTPVRGWQIISKKLYYVSKTGKCAAGRTYGGITFTKDGSGKNDTSTQLKIKTMETISKITNSKMTKNQKLRACFNYTMSCRFWGGKYPKSVTAKGWYKAHALDMITTRAGNCYGYACMFAALASELGYQPYIIDARIPGEHCFVMIDGRYYDNMGNRFGTAANQWYIVHKKWKY